MALDTGKTHALNDIFISYSRRDKDFAVLIQKALESYRPPRDLNVPQRNLVVFRDETDFTGVEYNNSLPTHLARSAKLIALCSPNARQSKFVNDEIAQFASVRGAENIVPVLIAGIPNNEAESSRENDKAFPEALVQAMKMPLACDYRGFERHRDKVNRGSFAGAWYKLLADIYGVSRSELEQRDKKREARRLRITASVTGLVITVLSGALITALISRQQAIERGEIALGRQLAAQSEVLRVESPNLLDRSALLAVEAARRTSGREIDRSLRAAVGLLPALLFEYSVEGQIAAVALSADGRLAAAGGYDGMVHVWDKSTGREIALIEHGDIVRSVLITPDGRYVASASAHGTILLDLRSGKEVQISATEQTVLAVGGTLLATAGGEDGRISLWDFEKGAEVRRLTADGPPEALSFSRDNRLLAAGGANNTLQVWSLGTGRELMRGSHEPASASPPLRLGSRDGGIFAVAFHPAGEYVASAGQDHTVRLWKIADGSEVFRGYQSDSVYSVAFSPNGTWLASGGMDQTARVWSLSDGSERYRLQHRYVVQKILWNDGGDLLTVGGDGTSRLWSMADGAELARMYHPDYIWDAAISPDGRTAITGDSQGLIRIWTPSGRNAVLTLTHPGARDAIYSPDGKLLVTAGESDYVQVWQLPEGKPTHRFRHEPFAEVASFSPDGKLVVTGGWDSMAHLWDAATGARLATLRQQGERVDAQFSPDGRLVMTASFENGSVSAWEVPSGREVFRVRHGEGVRSISFDPSGRTFATGGRDGVVQLWRTQTGEKLRSFQNPGFVVGATFTPDDQYLIVDSDMIVSVWQLSTGNSIGSIDKEALKDPFMHVLGVSPDSRLLLVGSLEQKAVQVRALPDLRIVATLLHDDDVFSAMFNKPGSVLLTASRDNTARIWDARTWQEVTRATASDFMYSALFSPDEKFFVTASGDDQVRVWVTTPSSLIDMACERLRRDLTQEESSQYLGVERATSTCQR